MKIFQHNLKTLFNQVSKHYPEIHEYENYDFLKSYCHESEKPVKTKKYHFGYNSLKWIIFALRDEIEKEKLERLFKNLIYQFFILKKTRHDLQYNILSFPESFYYKEYLKQENQLEADLKKLEEKTINDHSVIVNQTGKNLTSKIFKNFNPEIIVGANDSQGKKAIIFRANSQLVQKHQDKLSNIYKQLIKKEDGWTGINDNKNFNLFINQNSKLNDKQIIQILKQNL